MEETKIDFTEDLRVKLARLASLQEQRAMQEQILKNLNREITGLEAVVGYIKSKMKNESPR